MLERERRIIKYFTERGLWDKQFTEEAELLKYTLELLDMMPMTKVIRKEASTVAGIADLLICHRGSFVAIELKDDTGTTSQQQRAFLQEVQKAGGTGLVCRTLQAVYVALKMKIP